MEVSGSIIGAVIVVIIVVILFIFIISPGGSNRRTPSAGSTVGTTSKSTILASSSGVYGAVPLSYIPDIQSILAKIRSVNAYMYTSSPYLNSNYSMHYTSYLLNISGSEVYELNVTASNSTFTSLPIQLYLYPNGSLDTQQTYSQIYSEYGYSPTSGGNETVYRSLYAAYTALTNFLNITSGSWTGVISDYVSENAIIANTSSIKVNGIPSIETVYSLRAPYLLPNTKNGTLSYMKIRLARIYLESNGGSGMVVPLYINYSGVNYGYPFQRVFELKSLSFR
jgi:hypothetical protein